MAPTTTFLTATKSTPDSKVGIGFSSEKGTGKIMVVKVNDSSLFHGTKLRPGLEIVTINGTVVRGMTSAQVASILRMIEQDVVLEVRGTTQSVKIACVNPMAFARPALPAAFQDKNVSLDEWKEFLDTFENEMLPYIDAALQMDNLFDEEMNNFVVSQMVRGGMLGFGTESRQEQRALMLAQQSAIQHANLSMAASNVLSLANATFQHHGIRTKLTFQTRVLPPVLGVTMKQKRALVPTGIEFTVPMEV